MEPALCVLAVGDSFVGDDVTDTDVDIAAAAGSAGVDTANGGNVSPDAALTEQDAEDKVDRETHTATDDQPHKVGFS